MSQQPAHQSHTSQPFNQNPANLPQAQQHERSLSQGPAGQHFFATSALGPPATSKPLPDSNPAPFDSGGPPRLSTLPFQSAPNPVPSFPQNSSAYLPPPQAPTNSSHLPPLKPVFGHDLDELFQRDGSAVPMVVYQCIQAVDLFGLEVEGIYRLSGTASHITTLKALFDNGQYIQPVQRIKLANGRF